VLAADHSNPGAGLFILAPFPGAKAFAGGRGRVLIVNFAPFVGYPDQMLSPGLIGIVDHVSARRDGRQTGRVDLQVNCDLNVIQARGSGDESGQQKYALYLSKWNSYLLFQMRRVIFCRSIVNQF